MRCPPEFFAVPGYQPSPGVALKLFPRRLVPGYCVVAPGGGSAEFKLLLIKFDVVGVTGTVPHGPRKGAPPYSPPL